MISGAELQRWTAAVALDAENAHIGRFSTFALCLDEPGTDSVHLTYHHGALDVGEVSTPADRLELRGPASAWAELCSRHPAPRRHDLLALTKAPDGLEVVTGHEHLLRHLRVLNRLVELGRNP